jgi:hypothetical protein
MKFTLRRAKFDVSTTATPALVNDAFVELDTQGEVGNGLIPILKPNPIETVSGQDKAKINFINHANYDIDNNVEIKGVISDINPTLLNGALTDAATTVVCDDISLFPSGGGTIKIDNELIAYGGVSAGTTLTSCTRAQVDGDGIATTAAAHDDNSIVELYMFGGIPLVEINKTHTAVEDTMLDSFIIDTSTNATTTTTGGGEKVVATKNVQYDVLQPIVQTMELPYTTITSKLQTTTGTTVGSTQQSFSRLSATTAIDIPLNEDYYFDAPHMICSPINETNELLGNKSLRLPLTMSTTKDNVSPIIDTQRLLAICVMSRINNIDVIGDVNSNFTNYKPMTEAVGDNNKAIYITKKITLETAATALKVYLDAVKMSTSDITVLYKTQSVDAAVPFEDLGWTKFTGSSDTADGLPNPAVPTSKNRDDFKEYQYLAGKKVNGTGESLQEFNAFAVKIVMQGTNSSLPPQIKDFRAIALAT